MKHEVQLPGLRDVARRRLARQAPEQRAALAPCFADPLRISPQRRVEAVAEVRRRSALRHDGLAFQASLRGLVGGCLVVARAFLGMLEQVSARSAA